MATNGYRSTAAQRRQAEADRAARLAERDARWARLSYAEFLAEYDPDLLDPERGTDELRDSAAAFHARLIAEASATV